MGSTAHVSFSTSRRLLTACPIVTSTASGLGAIRRPPVGDPAPTYQQDGSGTVYGSYQILIGPVLRPPIVGPPYQGLLTRSPVMALYPIACQKASADGPRSNVIVACRSSAMSRVLSDDGLSTTGVARKRFAAP